MKDLIDERNQREKMKNSIVKFWNVNYVDAETLFGVLSGELPISEQTCNGKMVIQGRHDATIMVLEALVVN